MFLNKPAIVVWGVFVEKGTDSNLMAAAIYLFSAFFGVLPGIVLYLMAPKDKFVRFHAIQSIVVGIIIFVIFAILAVLSVIVYLAFNFFGMSIFGLVIIALAWLALLFIVFLLWLFLLYKAYKGERYGLPLIGNLAERYS
jgi:uncharacterized membrane protein